METEIAAEIADAFEFALASPNPTEADLYDMCTPTRSHQARAAPSREEARVKMPWDEGLVNSLVYDRPDPAKGGS